MTLNHLLLFNKSGYFSEKKMEICDFLYMAVWATTWLAWILGGNERCAVQRDLNVNRSHCQDFS